MEAAVDVDDLAADAARPVREQEADRASALPSTCRGRAVPTDARVAARRQPRSQDGGVASATTGSGVATSRAATLTPVLSAWELRTGGLHAERRFCTYPFERFPNQAGQHRARAGLDEAGCTTAPQGVQNGGPADRSRWPRPRRGSARRPAPSAASGRRRPPAADVPPGWGCGSRALMASISRRRGAWRVRLGKWAP